MTARWRSMPSADHAAATSCFASRSANSGSEAYLISPRAILLMVNVPVVPQWLLVFRQ